MEVNEEEFLEWKQHNVTQYVMQILSERKDSLQEQLGDGATLFSNTETALFVGRIQAYKDMLDIEYED